MFRGLINDAKSAAGSVVSKIVVRATVLVPFLIALGFATAGAALLLIEQLGARDAFFVLAAGFGVIGILAAILVRSKEQEDEAADEQAAQVDAEAVRPLISATETVTAAAEQMPLAFISSLAPFLSSQANPETLLATARGLGRNLPLVLLLGVLGLLLWPNLSRQGAAAATLRETDPVPEGLRSGPNGSYHSSVQGRT